MRLPLRLRHLTTIALLLLLAWLQWQLWTGRGSYPNVELMREEIAVQRHSNALMRQDNERLLNDIADLREGREMMEEIARQELGMIRPNEVFVQYTKP
ncbi:septum formation initiator family protein [Vandammella animalimorsus]|uniref:septum formation initiator family protein n=1 Tax=Vandammella animalimorsus TaxID=2029117 RepID=UPI00325AF0DE